MKNATPEFHRVALPRDDAFQQHYAVAFITERNDVSRPRFAKPVDRSPAEIERTGMIVRLHASAVQPDRFADKLKERKTEQHDAKQPQHESAGQFREKEIQNSRIHIHRKDLRLLLRPDSQVKVQFLDDFQKHFQFILAVFRYCNIKIPQRTEFEKVNRG